MLPRYRQSVARATCMSGTGRELMNEQGTWSTPRTNLVHTATQRALRVLLLLSRPNQKGFLYHNIRLICPKCLQHCQPAIKRLPPRSRPTINCPACKDQSTAQSMAYLQERTVSEMYYRARRVTERRARTSATDKNLQRSLSFM